MKNLQFVLKRVLDIAASLLSLVLLALPFALIALAIKLDSKGPIFFWQEETRGCLEHGDLLS